MAEGLLALARWPLASLVILGWSTRTSVAWHTSGVLEPRNGNALAYVGKFCFDEGVGDKDKAVGSVQIEVSGDVPDRCLIDSEHHKRPDKKYLFPLIDWPIARGGVYLAVFSDDFGEEETTKPGEEGGEGDQTETAPDEPQDSWKEMRRRWHELSCEDFLSHAAAVRAVTPVVASEFAKGGRFDASVFMYDEDRPQFVYFSFVYCGMSESCDNLPITYSIRATNVQQGYQAEFSMDEMGALPLQLAGALAFCALIAILWLVAYMFAGSTAGALRGRPLLQMLIVSALLSAAGCICLFLHNLVYAVNGMGLGWLQVVGELLACCARVTLTLLQVVVASGKALQPRHSTDFLRTLVLRGLSLGIVLANLCCEVYGRYLGDLDWSTTLYFYASWPGLCLLVFNAALFFEICRATRSILKEPDMPPVLRPFYILTFIIAVLYFCALPTTCALAHSLAPWHRKKLVARTEVAVRFTVTAALAVCFRPSRLDTLISARLEDPSKRPQAIELSARMPTTTEI